MSLYKFYKQAFPTVNSLFCSIGLAAICTVLYYGWAHLEPKGIISAIEDTLLILLFFGLSASLVRLIQFFIARRQKKEPCPEKLPIKNNKNKNGFTSDTPPKSMREDEFERTEYAKTLARHLCLEPNEDSIVVAIEDDWGAGKTAAINFVKQRLEEDEKKPIIVEFNPCFLNSKENVVHNFLTQFAAQVGDSTNDKKTQELVKAALKLSKFMAVIKMIPGAEPWGTCVENTIGAFSGEFKPNEIDDLNLVKQKKKLQKAIRALAKPIVVIVDDIDRLAPDDIIVVFQAIKAVCDFEGVSYLLAYDPEPVKKALSFNGVYIGRDYLDKIVQIPYCLPQLGYSQLKEFLKGKIKNLEKKSKIEIEKDELYNNALILAARALSTPRDVIRLINKLIFSSSTTKNKIYFPDLLLMEILSLKLEVIFTAIKTNPNQFTRQFTADGESVYQSVDPHLTKFLDEESYDFVNNLFEDYTKSNKQLSNIAKEIVKFLFPNAVKDNSRYQNKLSIDNGVHNKKALTYFLSIGSRGLLISQGDVKLFFESSQDRYAILENYKNRNGLKDFLMFLKSDISKHNLEDINNIFDSLVSIYQLYYEEEPPGLNNRVTTLIIALIDSLKEEESKKKSFIHIFNNTESLSINTRILNHYKKNIDNLEDNNNEDPGSASFTIDFINECTAIWLKSVRKKAETDDLINNEFNPKLILSGWGFYNSEDFREPQAYLSKYLVKNPNTKELFEKIGFDPSKENFQSTINKHIKLFEGWENLFSHLTNISKEAPDYDFAQTLLTIFQEKDLILGHIQASSLTPFRNRPA